MLPGPLLQVARPVWLADSTTAASGLCGQGGHRPGQLMCVWEDTVSSCARRHRVPINVDSCTLSMNIPLAKEAAVRVAVDRQACESNAVCMGFAPEVFEVTYDGTLVVLDEYPPETLRESVEEAARSCPRQAISIED
jgi:ferredoxin